MMNFKKTTAILMAGAITLMSNINILPQTMLNTASITANAVEIVKSGKCGENVTWTLDSNNTLTISGEGKMDDSMFYTTKDNLIYTTSPWGALPEYYNLIIQEGITNIANFAFYFDNIASISLPESLIGIGNNAFSFCNINQKPLLPKNLISIGNFAFYHANGFDSISIPKYVSNIGQSAFEGCNIHSIIVDADNEMYSSENGILFNNDKSAIIRFPINNTNTKYTIPDTVNTIEDASFIFCLNLTSLNIPQNTKTIKEHAIACCMNLTEITVDKNNTEYLSEDNILFSKDKTVLITYPAQLSAKEYTIPDSVTVIGSAAFSYSANLTSINIPHSVTAVKKGAFDNARQLTSIILPNSVNRVYEGAFYNCDKLESITFKNPECNIYDSEDTIDNGATIYGYENSTAQKYAEKYDRNFVIIDEKPVTTTPVVTTTTIPTTTTTTITTTSTIKTTTTTGSTTQPITTTVTTTPAETPQISFGDIDNNKSINANDASMILAEYAIISTNGKPKFTAEQMKAADVNSDGEVNAIDASLVLAYYAHISTGGTGSLADFIAIK